MSSTLKTLLLWAVVFVMVILLINLFQQGTRSKTELIEAGRDLARLTASYEVQAAENAALHAEIVELLRRAASA